MKKYVILFLLFSKLSFGQGWFSCTTPTQGWMHDFQVYNGKLVMAGNHNVILSYDGAGFDTIGVLGNWSNTVYGLEVYNNDLYIGGEFISINGITANGIARYDGVSWHAVGTGLTYPGGATVIALKEFNGELYVGGTFTGAGAIPANFIAKWNGSSWSTVGAGFDNSVSSFSVFQNELYAGGFFLRSGTDTVCGIAKWNGNVWQPLSTGVVLFNNPPQGHSVIAMHEYNGELYVGGDFYTAGGVYSPNLAKWDGTSWHSFPQPIDSRVSCMSIYNNKLFLGGFFHDWAAGIHYAGSWDGSTFGNLDSGIYSFSSIKQVWGCGVYNNRIYYGGRIAGSMNGVVSYGVIAWDEFTSSIEPIVSSENGLIVSPNPVIEKVHLSGKLPDLPYQVKIIDVSGRIVFESIRNDYNINCKSLDDGIYQLLISDGSKTFKSKILKLKD